MSKSQEISSIPRWIIILSPPLALLSLSGLIYSFYYINNQNYILFSILIGLAVLIITLLSIIYSREQIKKIKKDKSWENFIKYHFWGKNWVRFTLFIISAITFLLSLYTVQIEKMGNIDAFIFKTHFDFLQSDHKKEENINNLINKKSKVTGDVYLFCIDQSESIPDSVTAKYKNIIEKLVYLFPENKDKKTYFNVIYFSDTISYYKNFDNTNKDTTIFFRYQHIKTDTTSKTDIMKKISDTINIFKIKKGKNTSFQKLINEIDIMTKGLDKNLCHISVTILSDFIQDEKIKQQEGKRLDKNSMSNLRNKIDAISKSNNITFNLISSNQIETGIINMFKSVNEWYNVQVIDIKDNISSNFLNQPLKVDKKIEFYHTSSDNMTSDYILNNIPESKVHLSFVSNYAKYEKQNTSDDKYFYYPNLKIEYQVLDGNNLPVTNKEGSITMNKVVEENATLSNNQKLKFTYNGTLLSDNPIQPTLKVSVDALKKDYIIPISFTKTIPKGALILLFVLELLLLFGISHVMIEGCKYILEPIENMDNQTIVHTPLPVITSLPVGISTTEFKKYHDDYKKWVDSGEIKDYQSILNFINEKKEEYTTVYSNIEMDIFKRSLPILFEKGHWSQINNLFTLQDIKDDFKTEKDEWNKFINGSKISKIEINKINDESVKVIKISCKSTLFGGKSETGILSLPKEENNLLKKRLKEMQDEYKKESRIDLDYIDDIKVKIILTIEDEKNT
ncbi:MAG: VWA domain-containing protein [Bacteroidetes bacterium]|nr:MAG: VWA domain-containing protein [Bacteroidota bacterium]